MEIGWEEKLYLQYVKKNLKKEEPVLVDCGFNAGVFTDNFLMHFPNAQVYGFEPIPELYNKSVKKYSGLENIELHNYGLHNKNIQDETFYYLHGAELSGMSSIHYRPEHFPKYEHEVIKVQLITYDEIASKHSGLCDTDFMKIDTEGNELFVLQGMEKTFEYCPPRFIQVEYGGCYIDSKTTLLEVAELLWSKGYVIFTRDFSFLTRKNMIDNYEMQNYLAVLGQ